MHGLETIKSMNGNADVAAVQPVKEKDIQDARQIADYYAWLASPNEHPLPELTMPAHDTWARLAELLHKAYGK